MPTNAFEPLIIAHRGGGSLGPENTLAAARASYEAGADMWELDIEVTGDGVLVLAHDDSLVRTSNVKAIFPDRDPWLLRDFTYAELRRLDFGSWFQPEVDPFEAVAKPPRPLYAGERVATLEEALHLARTSGWQVVVELKDLKGGPGEYNVAEKAVSIILDLDMLRSVMLSSFRHDYLERARAASPDLRLGALVFTPVPLPEAVLNRFQAQVYMPPASAAEVEEVARLRTKGAEVYVWTVNLAFPATCGA